MEVLLFYNIYVYQVIILYNLQLHMYVIYQ